MAQEAAARRYARIQREPVPQGSPEFEKKRQELFDTFAKQVPTEYLIHQHYIDSPPRNVTSIPRECGILTDAELHITEQYDAFGLAHAIATRKLTAVEVTQAFLKRSIICDQISQCLTQWLPDIAMDRARQLDQHLEQTGKTVGPLHGVPISVKQHIPLAGTYSDTGFMSLIVFNEEDCHMISILRELGAVFYCKTAQPQAIMHLETDSYFGRTLNPHNIDLSAGGSSGGESALVALRGSVLGIGTDIGGSIRSPAGKCGIYGFKPTSYTLPTKDFLREGAACELNILASTGPLCNTMRDMELFMRSLTESKPWLKDPRLIPIPWTGLKTELGISTVRPLKMGIMFDDGVIQPQPPVTRAMKWAQTLLSASSLLELKPYKPYKPAEAILSIRKMYWPDGGAGCYKEAEVTGEPIHKLTLDVIKDSAGFDKNAYQMLEDRMYRDRFRSAFAEDWTAQDVDVILCPMFVGPAPLHDTSFYWNYTALWNFVDCPGVVFPTPIKAGAKGSESYKDAKTWNEKDAHVRKLWEDNDYENAPIALQLVARKYHDNQLFGALALLSEYLGLK